MHANNTRYYGFLLPFVVDGYSYPKITVENKRFWQCTYQSHFGILIYRFTKYMKQFRPFMYRFYGKLKLSRASLEVDILKRENEMKLCVCIRIAYSGLSYFHFIPDHKNLGEVSVVSSYQS